MDANIIRINRIKKELEDSLCVRQCAKRFGTTGDLTAMKICYLLRHYPELSVSEVAELTGVSISAASRSLVLPRFGGQKVKQPVASVLGMSVVAQIARD